MVITSTITTYYKQKKDCITPDATGKKSIKMAIKVKVTNELLRLAKTLGNAIYTKRDEYYYFPFYIKVKHDGSKELVGFEKLPEEVKQSIKLNREIDEKAEENTRAYPRTA